MRLVQVALLMPSEGFWKASMAPIGLMGPQGPSTPGSL